MKKILIIIGILLVAFSVWHYTRDPLGVKLTIGSHQFTVELAVTEAEKEKGLGYRDSLGASAGMLFVYDHPEVYQYWMKGMRFPLDFIWINGKTIVDLTKNVPVSSDGTYAVYQPKTPADKVLEVNAGTVDADGIRRGDSVKISF